MKKVVGLIVLGITIATAIAQAQQTDAEMLQKLIVYTCNSYHPNHTQPADARKRILESGIPQERVTEILEGIVRENLPVLEKLWEEKLPRFSSGISDSYLRAQYAVCDPIFMLREFPGPNTLALFRECASFIDHAVSLTAIETYIALEGGDSVPFLKELLEKNITWNSWLAQHLRGVIRDLKKQGRDEDVEKFHAFLLEQLQMEPSWNSVEELDGTLCVTLDDYPKSLQRAQAMQRFANMPDTIDWRVARQSHSAIQAQVDAVPADQRVDLSKRFKLAEPPKENGEN